MCFGLVDRPGPSNTRSAASSLALGAGVFLSRVSSASRSTLARVLCRFLAIAVGGRAARAA